MKKGRKIKNLLGVCKIFHTQNYGIILNCHFAVESRLTTLEVFQAQNNEVLNSKLLAEMIASFAFRATSSLQSGLVFKMIYTSLVLFWCWKVYNIGAKQALLDVLVSKCQPPKIFCIVNTGLTLFDSSHLEKNLLSFK